MFLASLLTIIKMSPLVKELWPAQDFTTKGDNWKAEKNCSNVKSTDMDPEDFNQVS